MNRESKPSSLSGLALLMAGAMFCIKALADSAVPPPMPPAMRNVLMWGQVEGDPMMDLETA